MFSPGRFVARGDRKPTGRSRHSASSNMRASVDLPRALEEKTSNEQQDP